MIIHTRFRKDKSGQPIWYTSSVGSKENYYDENKIKHVKYCFNKYGYVENVMHLIDKETLLSAFRSIKPYNDKDNINPKFIDRTNNTRDYLVIAPGIDNVMKYQYGKYENKEPNKILYDNISNLYNSLKNNSYKHKPIKRVYIKKSNEKYRPLGISCFEDKIVERAVTDIILVPIYEEIFEDTSYAYRTNLNCHKAINEVEKTLNNNNINYILEADIKGYFENVNHKLLIEMIERVIRDKKVIKYIKQVLKSGYIDRDMKFHKTHRGTPQGGIISPVLANIYLDTILDKWIKSLNFEGFYKLIRYADDFIILFECERDANKVYREINKRFKRYKLQLSKEKTNIIAMSEREHSIVNFLGYSLYKSDKGIMRDLNLGRLDKKLYSLASVLENINKDYYKYEKCNNDRLFYSDYIRWINNKLVGIYRYYLDDTSVNKNLISLYEEVVKITYRSFINAPNMTKEILTECLDHIFKPYEFVSLPKVLY